MAIAHACRLFWKVLDIGLCDGDEAVANAVDVSFVEVTGWWAPEEQPFIAAWPQNRRAEVERQRDWRSRT